MGTAGSRTFKLISAQLMSRLIKCKYTVKCEALKPVYEYGNVPGLTVLQRLGSNTVMPGTFPNLWYGSCRVTKLHYSRYIRYITSIQWERVAKMPAVVALKVIASPLKSMPCLGDSATIATSPTTPSWGTRVAEVAAQSSKYPCNVSICLQRMSRKVSISASFSASPLPLPPPILLPVDSVLEDVEKLLPWRLWPSSAAALPLNWSCCRACLYLSMPSIHFWRSSTEAARRYHTQSFTETSNRCSSSSCGLTSALPMLTAPLQPYSVSPAVL